MGLRTPTSIYKSSIEKIQQRIELYLSQPLPLGLNYMQLSPLDKTKMIEG